MDGAFYQGLDCTRKAAVHNTTVTAGCLASESCSVGQMQADAPDVHEGSDRSTFSVVSVSRHKIKHKSILTIFTRASRENGPKAEATAGYRKEIKMQMS